ncbi:hypothetical protein [Lactobacillus hominis]|uniref:Uncharacterized protein n=2 Tax=Lactobacillus hominis TaxID=1203033 RepID=I7KHD0_9LACO|nr:hypothetical protein [Lactobacillus hominis]MCT3347187.1 hypothetical protein [Lactobacillus hominis]CCI82005.1 Putative uncharacterized protein [Lactobacillus hominis DSM 23910 = CRBIP 24.179]
MSDQDIRGQLKRRRALLSVYMDILRERYGKHEWNINDPDYKVMQDIRQEIESLQKKLKAIKVPKVVNPEVVAKSIAKYERLKKVADRATESEEEREAKIVDLIEWGFNLREIRRRVRSTNAFILAVAQKHNLPLGIDFKYCLKSDDPTKPKMYAAAKKNIAKFLGYSPGTWVGTVASRLGYRLEKVNFLFEEIPIGNYFSVAADDEVRKKTSNQVSECEVVKIKPAKGAKHV